MGEKVDSLLPLRKEMIEVKEKLRSLNIRVSALEVAVRTVFTTELPAIKNRLTRLGSALLASESRP
ncbi:MAG: hypothetical protein COV74_00010 [Candidatus Omnitrophica bacterium CG11_big_fil_rev_8_21_14_0_20_45_26]|uniref:Uncharacterized protein n=1 Tax=Candidatus Abzuiibacterium crystallinum TaxID=1974748 RepID=A0A2H0LVS4_9BACT|nr:MAG: hypothetical protein COV74_00010 [Candidatus Omnitrophica bacterium CG11_big_fil_rev_8_21_14_0_20_45_26]PIW65785.1 MAG: hypothetical protein COW12_00010 [Candidatus Omnitrophica bacterium CG12_big_fil_rev_8_21_14_0_65_45_16]